MGTVSSNWSLLQLLQFFAPRILFSILCGGLIGLERELKNKPAGIEGRVSDAYPIKQPSELAWVKIMIRTLDMLDDTLGAPLPESNWSTLDATRRLWVAGQWAYFTNKRRSQNLSAETREEWSLVFLGLSPVVGAIGLLAYLFFVEDVHTWGHWRHYMIVAMGLLVGLGAIIAGHTEQLAYKAQGRQYDRMALLFERALLLVNRVLKRGLDGAPLTPTEIEQVQRLYVELGSEAMKEHAEWVAIYRQRPIRPAG